MAPMSFREATASKRLLWLLTEKLKLGLTSERHESIHEVAGLFACLKVGYRTFGVSFGAVFCCVGAVVRVLKLGWPGFMGGQKVCLGSGFFVVVPRDKSV